MLKKLPLSLVVITYNEERNIQRCIESVPFAKQIIIVDSLSPDKTVEIAKNLGAEVVLRKFTNFGDQKQFALGLATEPWVLSLDADECLSPKLQDEIVKVLTGSSKFEGYRVPRLSFHLGRWIRHGGWYPDYQTRLFQRASAAWDSDILHEVVSVIGPIGKLRNDILHFVFRDLDHQIETNNRYSSLGAESLYKRHEKFSLLKLVFKPFGKFFECYFFKLGFLDGAPGFIIALGAAQSLFLKYAKLWELTDTKKN